MAEMEAEYDAKSDYLYICVLPAERAPDCVARTAMTDDGVMIDYLRDERIFGYDIGQARGRGIDSFTSLPDDVREVGRRALDEHDRAEAAG